MKTGSTETFGTGKVAERVLVETGYVEQPVSLAGEATIRWAGEMHVWEDDLCHSQRSPSRVADWNHDRAFPGEFYQDQTAPSLHSLPPQSLVLESECSCWEMANDSTGHSFDHCWTVSTFASPSCLGAQR